MSSKPQEEVWPDPPIIVSPKVKQNILRFFEISDSIDTTSGRLFANELFTEDAVFTTHPTCIFRGREEIASSRSHNNPLIISRSHTLHRVFSANSPASDVMVSGAFTIGLKDGQSVEMDFTARFVFDDDVLRFKFVQVWTDSTEFLAALKRAEIAGV